MKKFIALGLLLCFICAATISCRLYETHLDTDKLFENTTDLSGAPDSASDLDTDSEQYPPNTNEYIFVNESKNICINHHYGNRPTDVTLLQTPALYDGDTESLKGDVNIWSELSGEHLILLAYEKTPENMDVAHRRITVHTTKDMGKNWYSSELELPLPITDEERTVTNMLLSMSAATDDVIGSIVITTDHNEIYFFATEDGGETWESRTYMRHYDTMHTGRLVDESIGFISFIAHGESGPEVFITENGGRDWQLMDIPVPDGYTGKGSYVNIACKYNGTLVLETVFEEGWLNYVSFDSGKTWEWEPH